MLQTELPPSSVFARRYRVSRRVGAGGFGSVYETTHVVTGRACALKVLLPHFAEDHDFRERFLRESQLTAKLRSDHIVDVLDAGIDAETDTPFIVMELLEGEDLARRLRRKKRFAPDETLVYLSQVAAALEKTHAASIIHRDLKPGNLFLTRRADGSPLVKVLDFGVAKVVAEQSVGGPTQSAGTPLYMAPEQFQRGPISTAVDVYALGMLAFTFLVGRHYYTLERRECANAFMLALTLAEGPPEPARLRAQRYGVALPVAFDAWFATATHHDSKLRFSDATELVLGLAKVLGVEAREPLVRRAPIRFTGALSRCVEAPAETADPPPLPTHRPATQAASAPPLAPYSGQSGEGVGTTTTLAATLDATAVGSDVSGANASPSSWPSSSSTPSSRTPTLHAADVITLPPSARHSSKPPTSREVAPTIIERPRSEPLHSALLWFLIGSALVVGGGVASIGAALGLQKAAVHAPRLARLPVPNAHPIELKQVRKRSAAGATPAPSAMPTASPSAAAAPHLDRAASASRQANESSRSNSPSSSTKHRPDRSTSAGTGGKKPRSGNHAGGVRATTYPPGGHAAASGRSDVTPGETPESLYSRE